MAHKTGAAFADYGAHIIHGAANAMYLPKVIAFNAKDETAKKRYAYIVDRMGIADKSASDDDKVKALIAYLRGMNDELKIPHSINHYGKDSYPTETGFVPENVFLERLPEIAKNAIADACTGSNPRQPSQEERRSCSSAATMTPRLTSNQAPIRFLRGTPEKTASPVLMTGLDGKIT